MADDSIRSKNDPDYHQFVEHYGTEEQCFDTIYLWRWPNGFRYPHCDHDRYCQLTHRKLLQCNRCRRQTSVTAGSEFDSTKLPLTVWFRALYLLTRYERPISAMALHRALDVSYNAAWRMKRKLMRAVTDTARPLRLDTRMRLADETQSCR